MTLTLAAGWRVGKRGSAVVVLVNAAATVFLSVATGPASGTAVEALKQDIQNDMMAADEGQRDYRNVQIQDSPQNDPPPNTQKYDSGADATFTAQGATGSGLTSVTGVYGELVDSTNQSSVLVIAYSGSESDLEAAHPAIKSMSDSLLTN